MEESPYSEIKKSLSSVSLKALNYSSRLILANNLDYKQELLSEKGFARDYKGLAELIGFPFGVLKMFEEYGNRTMKILEAWETRQNSTIDKLIDYLEDMGRYDVIEELIPSLQKSVESYKEYQKSLEGPIQVQEVTSGPLISSSKRGMVTLTDMKYQEQTIYDAYVSYAEEDTYIAAEFAQYLESPKFGLKLFIRGRDMLAGCPKYDTDIELIKNRCRHMLILLTPNFIHSSEFEFQVSFAGSLAIEQKQRVLIPVVLSPCEIPAMINTVSKIDFTKEYTQEWERNKLIVSLLPEEKVPAFLSSLGSNAVKFWNAPPLQPCYIPPPLPTQSFLHADNKPVITYPPSEKHSIKPVQNVGKVLSIIPADIEIEYDNKDSSSCNSDKDSNVSQDAKEPGSSKSPSSRFQQFMSLLRRKTSSSSSSSTSPNSNSSLSSGYLSQSCSNLESFENM